MRNPYAIGFVDPEIVAEVAGEFIKLFGGTDAVPDYPIKKIETFNSLLASINTEIPLPPATISDAQRLLEKASAMYADHQNAGKWGTGAANTTVLMLLAERITALQQYINTKGGTFALPAAGSGSTTQQVLPPTTLATRGNFLTDTGLFNLPNWLTFGAAGIGIYFLIRKKR